MEGKASALICKREKSICKHFDLSTWRIVSTNVDGISLNNNASQANYVSTYFVFLLQAYKNSKLFFPKKCWQHILGKTILLQLQVYNSI